jgi:hypothetical protein
MSHFQIRRHTGNPFPGRWWIRVQRTVSFRLNWRGTLWGFLWV